MKEASGIGEYLCSLGQTLASRPCSLSRWFPFVSLTTSFQASIRPPVAAGPVSSWGTSQLWSGWGHAGLEATLPRFELGEGAAYPACPRLSLLGQNV